MNSLPSAVFTWKESRILYLVAMIVSPPSNRKYWESIWDKLHAKRWSPGVVRAMQDGVLVWIVDASNDGERHNVQAEEITVAFLELETSCRS